MTDDQRLAAELATEAGRRLVGLRGRMAGEAAHEVRDAGDASSHEFLVARLADARPDDAVLSEEGRDDPARLDARRLWIVDPLDGTREYGEPGRIDWAVHVALWERGSLVAAAVALPAEEVTFSAGGELPERAEPQRPLRMVVSRSRPPLFVDEVARRIGAVTLPHGSAGGKAMAVVRGDADIYLHAGAMREWDSAAPAGVAAAAGLHVSRFDGSPLQFNTPRAITDQLLICPPSVAEEVMAAIAAR